MPAVPKILERPFNPRLQMIGGGGRATESLNPAEDSQALVPYFRGVLWSIGGFLLGLVIGITLLLHVD